MLKDIGTLGTLLKGNRTECLGTSDGYHWNTEVIIDELYSFDKYVLVDDIGDDKEQIKDLLDSACQNSEIGIVPKPGPVPDLSGREREKKPRAFICVQGKLSGLTPASNEVGGLIGQVVRMAILDPKQVEDALRNIFITSGPDDGHLLSPGVRVALQDHDGRVANLLRTFINLARPIFTEQEGKLVDWWKAKTGQNVNAACYDFGFRHTGAGRHLKGLPIVHIDQSRLDETAYLLMSDHMAKQLKMPGAAVADYAVLMFNKWINAGQGPIKTLPLTVLDTTTLKKKDIDLMWLQNGLMSKGLHFREEFRWYYAQLQPGQGYVFATMPHEDSHHKHKGVKLATPHSAFNIEKSEESQQIKEEDRSSFEMRCVLVDHFVLEDKPGWYITYQDATATRQLNASWAMFEGEAFHVPKNAALRILEVDVWENYVRGRFYNPWVPTHGSVRGDFGVGAYLWITLLEKEGARAKERFAFKTRPPPHRENNFLPPLTAEEARKRAAGQIKRAAGQIVEAIVKSVGGSLASNSVKVPVDQVATQVR